MPDDLLPISPEDLAREILIALTVMNQRGYIPQMKGPGAPKDPDRRRQDLNIFAKQLVKHLTQSNIVFMRAPPLPPGRGTGEFYKKSGGGTMEG